MKRLGKWHPSFLAIVVISALVLGGLAGVLLIPLLSGRAQTPPPALILNGNVVPGGMVSVQGRNFSPGGTVTFTIDGNTNTIASGSSASLNSSGTHDLALASLSLSQLAPQTAKAQSAGTSITVKSDGSFAAIIQVDPHWLIGSSHLLVATEQSSGQQAHLTIAVPHPAALVSCSASTGTTSIVLGPVTEGQGQPVSTLFTLCTTGSGMVQWTASWNQQQANWLQVVQSGNIQAPLSKQLTISASASGLKAGIYNATVTFSDPNSPMKVSLKVMFVVRSAQVTVCLNTDSQSLSFTTTQGQASPGPQTVTLSNCGASGSWTTTTHTDDGANWLNANPASGQLNAKASSNVQVAVSSSSLAKGIYTGQVTFVMGIAIAVVNVMLIVQPSQQNPPCITVAPQSLTFSATQGQGNPAPQIVTIGNCGPAGSWSATPSTTDGTNWLNINPATSNLAANASQNVSLSVSSANLPIGTYTGQAKFKLGSSIQIVNVAFTILQPQQKPCISVNTQSLPFTAIQGQSDPASQTVTLTNCGPTGSWSASAANGSRWLSINPSSNNLNTGATQDVSAGVSIAGLTAGTYNDTIAFTITTSAGATSQATVSIMLTVQPPPPPPCLQITSINGQPPASSSNGSVSVYPGTTISVIVTNCGSDTGALSAGVSTSDNGNWLTDDLQPNSTLPGGGPQTIMITVSGTAPYYATGTVTITLTTGGGSTSVTINISVANPIS